MKFEKAPHIDGFLSTQEVADKIGMNSDLVRSRLKLQEKKKNLKRVNFQKHVYIKESDIKFLADEYNQKVVTKKSAPKPKNVHIDGYFTIKELSVVLGKTVRNLTRKLSVHKYPFMKQNGRNYIPVTDVSIIKQWYVNIKTGRPNKKRNIKKNVSSFWKVSVFSYDEGCYLVKGVCFDRKTAKETVEILSNYGILARATKHCA